jgi:Type IV secretory pathway, VirD4 components
VVDPKGEAAEFTAKNKAPRDPSRLAILDPFEYANLPHAFRVRFNPLDLVTDTDDLRMLANGMIMRTGAETDPFWNDSAEAIIA